MTKAQLHAVLEQECAASLDDLPESKSFSAAQYAVFKDKQLTRGSLGVRSFESKEPVDDQTPFDLASVTKVFTATLALVAFDHGLAEPQTLLSHYFPLKGTDSPTLLELMNHSSGFDAWYRYYEDLPMRGDAESAREARDFILKDILRRDREPPGEAYAYSDLGYIVLGRALETIFERPLEDAIEESIVAPLFLNSIRFVSAMRGDDPVADAAATEYCPVRGHPVVGVVHDENTWIQGGVAGHAGLFGTATDVARFGQHLLNVYEGSPGIVSPELVRWAWSDKARGKGHHLAGWDTPSGDRTSVGRGFSRQATVGHLGFTGTSLWIDHSASTVAALNTNRVYPTRENSRILNARIRFHESVLAPEA